MYVYTSSILYDAVLGLSSRDSENPNRTAGVSFRDLSASGYGFPTDYQKTFGNYILELGNIVSKLRGTGKRKIQILRNFDGLVKSGEMLVVLGRPGSGCSTLLKTISGETNGFNLDPSSKINYQGQPNSRQSEDSTNGLQESHGRTCTTNSGANASIKPRSTYTSRN